MSKCLQVRLSAFLLAALAMLVVNAQVWAGDNEPYPQIRVTGQGTANVAPDMAVLTLTVTREADTARAALDANSAAMAKVLGAMQAEGIAERDLQTSNFSIQPRYTRPPRNSSGATEAPRISGYTVRNSLTVRLRDIGKLGAVLDKSVTLGVNEGGSIMFTNDDPSGVVTQARVKAVQDAMAKAQTLAGAAGVKTGKVLEISEQSHGPRPMPMARAEMAMASSADAVPVAAGENTYKVMVNISVAIEQ
jgi:uncharacterized protein YggE